MSDRTMDRVIVAGVAGMVLVAFVLAGTGAMAGRFLMGAGLITYGTAGLIRRRILISPAANLLQGAAAVLVSLLFIGGGIIVLY